MGRQYKDSRLNYNSLSLPFPTFVEQYNFLADYILRQYETKSPFPNQVLNICSFGGVGHGDLLNFGHGVMEIF